MCCERKFVEGLRARGLRLTSQRELVLSVMHDIEARATADEIYTQVQQQNASVDRSTVYRTLDLLQELHLVAALDLGDGQRRFELQAPHGPHHYLRCRVCGKLVAIETCDIEPLLAHLATEHGFEIEPGQLLTGLCADCQRIEAARSARPAA